MSHSTLIHKCCLVLGICLALVVATHAQTQGMKEFGNRLEGTNVHLDALEDFTLIAVHRNFTAFSRNANLNVRFFLPRLPGNPKKNVFVEALELQDSFHYFMQSKSSTWNDDSWNIFSNWPLSTQQLKCDSVRPLPSSSSAYKNRGNRCEGLYVADVSSKSIDIISFTSGSISYDLNSKLPLKVAVLSKSSPVNVRAVAVTPKTYYRMDAFVLAGATLIWPVTDVLLPENLTDNRIGIFGWVGTESAKIFVPVRVVSGSSAPAVPSSDHVVLLAQTSFDADSIKWRWARTQGSGCLAFGNWEDAILHPIMASSPVKIDFKKVSSGVDCVELVARSQDSNNWVTLKIRVEMP